MSWTQATAPQPREFAARVCVSCRNALGESPVWSGRDATLYWVSAVEGELWRWNLRDAPFKVTPRFGTTRASEKEKGADVGLARKKYPGDLERIGRRPSNPQNRRECGRDRGDRGKRSLESAQRP